MELQIIERNNQKVAKVVSDKIELKTVQDALDLMANADYQGARSLVLHKENIDPAFFDLSSRIAGEILQKCVNYSVKIAIVGDFAQHGSKSLNAFILECNRGRDIFFLPDTETAISKLTGT